jgi:hypothetical protein
MAEKKLTFEQAGEAFSVLLVDYANHSLEVLIKNQDIDKSKRLIIKKLFLFLFIHYIDRIAFSLLSSDNRTKLMNPIGYKTIKSFISVNNIKNSNDSEIKLLGELNTFSIKFNKYKNIIPSTADDSPKKTLFWEFSKEVSIQFDNSYDISNMLLINEMLVYSTKSLKVEEIVEMFK